VRSQNSVALRWPYALAALAEAQVTLAPTIILWFSFSSLYLLDITIILLTGVSLNLELSPFLDTPRH
jgi:hypothetical protein